MHGAAMYLDNKRTTNRTGAQFDPPWLGCPREEGTLSAPERGSFSLGLGVPKDEGFEHLENMSSVTCYGSTGVVECCEIRTMILFISTQILELSL